MATSDQAPTSEGKNEAETIAEEAPAPEAKETLAEEAGAMVEGLGGNGDPSSRTDAGSPGPEEDGSHNTLARADELFEKGSKAIEDGDFVEAVDCLSRALEIRVAHCGELAQECASSYYKYGCALLYKSQEEADPLGSVPKSTPPNSVKDNTASSGENSGSSKASNNGVKEDSPPCKNEEAEKGGGEKDQGDDEEGSEADGEDSAEADEDESDLDLAWKMLDVARAIVEKCPEDTLEKVNILAALGEASMEREDIDTSLSDYQKALSILERLVEPDHRRIVELNFRISLVLEIGSKIDEAIPYCEKAISLCRTRLQKLKENAINSTDFVVTNGNSTSAVDKSDNLSSEEASSGPSKSEDEIELLSGILTELEKKLEDLQQSLSNPSSVVSEVMKMIASKSLSGEKNPSDSVARSSSLSSSQMGVISAGFDSPSMSTAGTNGGGITHLGVVGRGIKRATVNPIPAEPSLKRHMLDSSAEITDSSTISTAGTNDGGITHLGVVGRGIKRATVNPIPAEPSSKRHTLDSSAEKTDGSTSEALDSIVQDPEAPSK